VTAAKSNDTPDVLRLMAPDMPLAKSETIFLKRLSQWRKLAPEAALTLEHHLECLNAFAAKCDALVDGCK